MCVSPPEGFFSCRHCLSVSSGYIQHSVTAVALIVERHCSICKAKLAYCHYVVLNSFGKVTLVTNHFDNDMLRKGQG